MAQPRMGARSTGGVTKQATNRQIFVPIPSAPLPPKPEALPIIPSINRPPALPSTSPGNDWVIDFEDVEAYNEARVAGNYSSKLMDAWLRSEQNWKYRIGKSWSGKKILGRGGQGIVGHWTYEGADRDLKSVKDIAVKQALRSGAHSSIYHFLASYSAIALLTPSPC
jgi:hypothetical protein